MPPDAAPATLTDQTLTAALTRWQAAAGPLWPYVGVAPFLAQVPAQGKSPVRIRLPSMWRAALPAPDAPRTIVFVDLALESTVLAAPRLSQLGFAVVPIGQRWIAPRSLLYGERLLDHLIAASQSISYPTHLRGVVCLLDGIRAGRPSLAPRGGPLPRFDNRYRYPTCRFPPAALLRTLGIERVRWYPSSIAPDLLEYALRLESAGIRDVGSAAGADDGGPP